MIFWKSTQILFIYKDSSQQARYHENIYLMTEPNLLIKNFVAKWSWMQRFSDWLGFCSLLGNVNERAPSHKATFEESVIRWLPHCLLNCSRLSARCMTPCHLQGFTSGSICVSVCTCVCACIFWKQAQKDKKKKIKDFYTATILSFEHFCGVLNSVLPHFRPWMLAKVYSSEVSFFKTTENLHGW